MKAEPAQQQLLLDLQALDTRLRQIDHARGRTPEAARVVELEQARRVAEDVLVRAETAASDLRRELARADADVTLVRERAARDQARLDSGQGSAKDLAALQHELASLARRQSTLEDVELEVMERAEAAESALAAAATERDRVAGELAEAARRRDAALAELDAQRVAAAAPRAALAGRIDDALLALYDRACATSGGLGAAPLAGRRCGGCQLELNPVALNALAKAPADEVLRCEECDRILVRVPDPAA